MSATAAYNKNITGPITSCPVCGSDVWDNTAGGKKNPRGPDYKCKNDGDHAFWFAKGAAPNGRASAPARQSVNVGHIPALDGADAGDEVMAHLGGARFDHVSQLYGQCLRAATEHATTIHKAGFPLSSDTIAAMAATLFIQASNKGL